MAKRNIKENCIENEIIKFMRSRGWRVQRNTVGVFNTSYGAKISVGTKGMPDWTFIRRTDKLGVVQLVHVEVKRPGARPNPKQYEVLASLNHIGEFATWADSLEMFKLIYFKQFSDDDIK